MRSIFRRTTHFFQRTSTRAPRRLSVLRAFTRGPANVAFHGASSASDRLSARRGGVLLRLCSRTGFPLTLHSDRFPPDRMNGSGLRRPRAPSIVNGFSGEPEGQSTTSATDVKVEHTRERPVTPRAGDLSADGWPSKACGRQSTGYPAGSLAPALPVTSTRPSFGTNAREACSSREWAPLSDNRAAENPERAPARSVPQGPPSTCRANGKAVERTRVPSRRSEPRLFTVAPRRLQRSRTKASIFHASDGGP